MTVTPEMQTKFNIAFSKIMSKTTPQLQKKWNGKIEWIDYKSYPVIPFEIVQDLPPGAKAAYVMLLNKLSRGTL